MSLSENRKFDHQQGEKFDYWQKQCNKLGQNPNGHSQEYQDFLRKANDKLLRENFIKMQMGFSNEVIKFKQKNDGWDFNKFRNLSKEGISGLSSEERLQYRDFLVSRVHDNKVIARVQANLLNAGYDLGQYGIHGVDGKKGTLTTKAIKSFQEFIGLKPTGELDQETWLGLELVTELGLEQGEQFIGEKRKQELDKKLQPIEKEKRNDKEIYNWLDHEYDFSKKFWNERQHWLFPVKGKILRDPNTGGRNFGADRAGGRKHAGIDLVVEPGTEVLAMTDGEVIRISKGFYAGTDAVEVINSDGTIARYAEIRSNCKIGGKIKRGDVIGKVIPNTKTGASMLHLEIYLGEIDGNLIKGSLTDTNNSSNYLYVVPQNYQRRKDLIDPTGLLSLKKESI